MDPHRGALRIRSCLDRKPRIAKRGRFGHRGGIVDKNAVMDDAIAATRIIPTARLLPRSFEQSLPPALQLTI
jgi:hypothetical protein